MIKIFCLLFAFLWLNCAREPSYLNYSIEDSQEAEKINKEIQLVKVQLKEAEILNQNSPSDSLTYVIMMLSTRLEQLESLHRTYKQSASENYQKYREAGTYGGTQRSKTEEKWNQRN